MTDVDAEILVRSRSGWTVETASAPWGYLQERPGILPNCASDNGTQYLYLPIHVAYRLGYMPAIQCLLNWGTRTVSMPSVHLSGRNASPPRSWAGHCKQANQLLFADNLKITGAPVVQWLYLPPNKVNGVQFLVGSSPDFHTWESCWTMQLVGWFSWGSPAPLCNSALLLTHLVPLSSVHKTSLLRAARQFFVSIQVVRKIKRAKSLDIPATLTKCAAQSRHHTEERVHHKTGTCVSHKCALCEGEQEHILPAGSQNRTSTKRQVKDGL
ncbi:hypothetical protein PR048_013584 [Dryococelus australis]|uniref:Uncharacterized protein n=1 Tax=Dryococelus australis TaxID=614101 RepID=A0ABQ9HSK8_9NEOP|nr:hypothetical protein PR048_013584 [Dryococelus australis]